MIYLLLYFSFDSNIKRINDEVMRKLKDHKLQSLLNGSDINNIPNLNIVSPNSIVTVANSCSRFPVRIHENGTINDCIRTCANSSASILHVKDGDSIIWNNSQQLQGGTYCTVSDVPECNMKTTNALLTINSVICKSKFPELVGGRTGNTIVACNNSLIYDPRNVLWDYKYNKPFNAFTTIINDTDELLFNNEFRFRCKFDGQDIMKNNYIEHPKNRFQPIRNYCASQVYKASKLVKTKYDEHFNYTCDCGNVENTRVQHIDPNDDKSLCINTEITNKIEVISGVKKQMSLSYHCFTMNSPLEEVAKYPPCPPHEEEVFADVTNRMGVIKIPFSEDVEALIEHPEFDKFKHNGYQKSPIGELLK